MNSAIRNHSLESKRIAILGQHSEIRENKIECGSRSSLRVPKQNKKQVKIGASCSHYQFVENMNFMFSISL
jgi:hypothetical protein